MTFDADTAIGLSSRLAGVCAAILSLEVLIDRKHYRDDGLLGWPVMQVRYRQLVASWYAPAIAAAERYPVFLAVTSLRLGAALLLMLDAGPRAIWLSVLAFAGLLFGLRTSVGTDGADQLSTITLLALTADAWMQSPWVRLAVLWFLAAELVLSYVSAGIAKAFGREWREGRAAWEILSTRMYGIPALGRWLHAQPRLSFALSWGILLFEIGFIAVFFVPPGVGLAIVAAGVSFHIFNAIVMGLNTFLWSFLAAYPALVWVIVAGLPRTP